MSNKYQDSIAGSLDSIGRGAFLWVVGRIFSQVATLLLIVLITRSLGADGYGTYGFAVTIVTTSLFISRAGVEQSLSKFVPIHEDEGTGDQLLGTALGVSIALSAVVSVLLIVFADVVSEYTLQSEQFVVVLRILAATIIVRAVLKGITHYFRASDRMEYNVFINNFFRPVAQIALVALVLFLGYSLVAVALSVAGGFVIATLVSILLLVYRTDQIPAVPRSRKLVTEYVSFSSPMIVRDSAYLMMRNADTLMVGYVLASSTDVGIYKVAFYLTLFLLLPLHGVNQLFPPVASQLYSAGDIDALNSVYSTVTRWCFSGTLLLTIGLVGYRQDVLHLFGADFVAGEQILLLFCIARVVGSAVGPTDQILLMAGSQRLETLNLVVFGTMNVVLNYLFLNKIGIIGAALATSIVYVLSETVRIGQIYYLLGINPYSATFLKPVLAGLGTVIVVWLSRTVLTGIPLLVVGAVAGGLAFVTLLLLVGLEEEDRILIESITPSD